MNRIEHRPSKSLVTQEEMRGAIRYMVEKRGMTLTKSDREIEEFITLNCSHMPITHLVLCKG